MLCEGLLDLVKEQLDLRDWELEKVLSHPVDFDFVVREGVVEFFNGEFTYFRKYHGGFLVNVESLYLYPTIIELIEKDCL